MMESESILTDKTGPATRMETMTRIVTNKSSKEEIIDKLKSVIVENARLKMQIAQLEKTVVKLKADLANVTDGEKKQEVQIPAAAKQEPGGNVTVVTDDHGQDLDVNGMQSIPVVNSCNIMMMEEGNPNVYRLVYVGDVVTGDDAVQVDVTSQAAEQTLQHDGQQIAQPVEVTQIETTNAQVLQQKGVDEEKVWDIHSYSATTLPSQTIPAPQPAHPDSVQMIPAPQPAHPDSAQVQSTRILEYVPESVGIEQDVPVKSEIALQVASSSPPHQPSEKMENTETFHILVCPACFEVFTGPNELEKHLCLAIHVCEVCDKKLGSAKSLKEHMVIHTKNYPHRCDQCDKGFTQKKALRIHKVQHTGKKSFQCDICGRQFLHRNSLRMHTLSHTGETPHCCKVCGKGYKNRHNLNRHMLIHSDVKVHCCDKCEESFHTLTQLKSHKLDHTAKMKYKCAQCPERFRNLEKLKTHWTTHTGVMPYHCEVCNKGFVLLNAKNKHMLVHSDTKPFTCKVCSKTFKRKNQLEVHMKTHPVEEQKHACDDCEEVFADVGDLTAHKLTHEDEKGAKFACARCKKRFHSVARVKDHIRRTHLTKKYSCPKCKKKFAQSEEILQHVCGDDAASVNAQTGAHAGYPCSVCGKSFQQPTELRNHAASHVKPTSNNCTICGKHYSTKAGLEAHAKIPHQNGKPYVCAICGKGFMENYHLKKHVSSHRSSPSSRECPVCGKVYNSANYLRVHMQYHAGLKLHQCEQCDKSFTSASDLKRHSFVHTDSRPFECEQCERSFTQRNRLDIHIIKDHS